MDKEILQQAQELVAQMTLEEKAGLCSGKDFWHLKGVERLDLPEIMVTDGPHGLRKQVADADNLGLHGSVSATCFPTAAAMASTWDTSLVKKLGIALGEECREEEVSVVLGPGANIKRSPLCGRNFEYFSEDPFLTGELALAHIQGVQSQGIGTSLKHFAANNQEEGRLYMDSVVDSRTLREIYFTGFEKAVKAGNPDTIMCAYNRLNGTYCSENPWLLNSVLRDEWGFDGLVVSDWGAVSDRAAGVAAGMDLEMPSSFGENDKKIIEAVESGELAAADLDKTALRIVSLILKTQVTNVLSYPVKYDREMHHDLAREIAADGTVLLQNRDNLLPLNDKMKIAVVGGFAKNPRYQGAGSSMVNPTRLDTAYDAILKLIGEEQISYAQGYSPDGQSVDITLIDEACAIAENADAVVVFAGLPDSYESEGFDRTHMQLPESHNQLIQRLVKTNTNTVVVLCNGSPVELPWVKEVPSILEAYLGGQAGGSAAAEVLFGIVNPSGHLAETFPVKLEDTPCYEYFPGGNYRVQYREGLNVGYRYYSTVQKQVRFPFGHGLSYTSFSYTDIAVSERTLDDGIPLTVSVVVKNTGQITGKEVVQIYIRDKVSSVYRPDRELKGFAKVQIEPGESETVKIELDARAFAFFDPLRNDWIVEEGEFEILAGSSVENIHLQETIYVRSAQKVLCEYPAPDLDAKTYSDELFETIYRKPLPQDLPDTPEYTLDTPLSVVKDTQVGSQLYAGILGNITKMFGSGEDSEANNDAQKTARMFQRIISGLPVRGIAMFSGGTMTLAQLEGMVMMMNQERISK
jgi:beta-glucosidase